MVRHWIFLFLLMPFFLFSGEFTATVNRTQINEGESLVLQLTLKDATAKGIPVFNSLRKSFLIHSQQQASNTVVVNGSATSSVTWKITLIPQEVGNLEIESISIDTSEGRLSSEPIVIHVMEGITPANSESPEEDGVVFKAEVSNEKPYKNEPFIYTIKLISKKNLVNLQLNKPEVRDAMVETNGDPKIYHQIVGGMREDIIEFSYLITPLKAGALNIPPAIIQGGVPIKRKAHGNSLFDHNFDPFLMMQGFDQIQPFMLKTEPTTIDVQPAALSMVPWLPAKSLKIEEIWDPSQSLQAGDPFTRSFIITAEGMKSGQLPSLNDLQVKNAPFKIYADSPELADEVKDGVVKSSRKELYTLIPEQSGSLTLPEISVAWWDVVKKEKCIASIPARTFQVMPPAKLAPSDIAIKPEPQTVIVQRDPILYAIIVGLAIMLIAAVFLGVMLQKKITRLTEVPGEVKKAPVKVEPVQPVVVKKAPKNDKKEKLPDLNPT